MAWPFGDPGSCCLEAPFFPAADRSREGLPGGLGGPGLGMAHLPLGRTQWHSHTPPQGRLEMQMCPEGGSISVPSPQPLPRRSARPAGDASCGFPTFFGFLSPPPLSFSPELARRGSSGPAAHTAILVRAISALRTTTWSAQRSADQTLSGPVTPRPFLVLQTFCTRAVTMPLAFLLSSRLCSSQPSTSFPASPPPNPTANLPSPSHPHLFLFDESLFSYR